MPKLTKLSIATAAIMLAVSPATFAQDDPDEIVTEAQIVNAFTSADIDTDGGLDRDEFVSFVIMKSDAGYADYSSIKLSGEYDNHFNIKDYNADGLLSVEELSGPEKNETSDTVPPEMDVPVDEPD